MRILFTTAYDTLHYGLHCLASYMQQNGHDVHMLLLKKNMSRYCHYEEFSNVKNIMAHYNSAANSLIPLDSLNYPITEEELFLYTHFITNWKPDLICLSNRSAYDYLLPVLISTIRTNYPRAKIACGGFGPTLNPELPLKHDADFVIRGEGEEALLDLVQCLDSGSLRYEKIKNLVFINNGTIIYNSLREVERNLDKYPFPLYKNAYRTIIDNDMLITNYQRNDSIATMHYNMYTILTNRGCMMQCSYCAAGTMRKIYNTAGLSYPRIRFRSLRMVLDELRDAKNNGANFINFADEYLVRTTEELIHFFKSYKLYIGLPFFAYFNVQQLLRSEDLLDTIVDAGLFNTALGVQTGCELFAKNIYNRYNINDDFIHLMEILQHNGIHTTWNYIACNPLATASEFEETLKFAKRVPYTPSHVGSCDLVSIAFTPLQKTPIIETYPELHDFIADKQQFYYESQLLYLRMLLSDDEFERIEKDIFYKNYPQALHILIERVKQNNHFIYMTEQAKRLSGKEVFFFINDTGGGDIQNEKAYIQPM